MINYDKTTEDFKKELKTLLEKYNATIGFYQGNEQFEIYLNNWGTKHLDYWVDSGDL